MEELIATFQKNSLEEIGISLLRHKRELLFHRPQDVFCTTKGRRKGIYLIRHHVTCSLVCGFEEFDLGGREGAH
jgi:hypothetical protein